MPPAYVYNWNVLRTARLVCVCVCVCVLVCVCVCVYELKVANSLLEECIVHAMTVHHPEPRPTCALPFHTQSAELGYL